MTETTDIQTRTVTAQAPVAGTRTQPADAPRAPAGGPRLALGAMLFGTTIDDTTAFRLLDAYLDAGGEWIDTADCYAFWVDPSGHGGQSEEMLGRWFAARPGARDRVRISTKVGCEPLYPGSFPELSEGLSDAVVRASARRSLQRMGIDRIDLLWGHRDDRSTDLAETVGAFSSLVDEGILARWGYSNTALWRVERARGIAAATGQTPPTAVQLRYSYLQPRPMVRDHDHDHRFGWITDDVLDYTASNPQIDLWAYRPLLAGAYDRTDRPVSDAFRHPGTDARLAVLDRVARELGRTRSEIVMAWLTGGSPAITPVFGVSSVEQLDDAVAGSLLELPPEVRAELDEPW